MDGPSEDRHATQHAQQHGRRLVSLYPRLEIIREREFDEQLLRLVGNMVEVDEFTAGAEHLLGVEPRAGLPVNAKIWSLPRSTVRGRRVSIFYSLDETAVVLPAILPHDD